MKLNPWTNGLCLKCKTPLIVIDDTHMCTACQEEISKMVYDLKHSKKPKSKTGTPRKVMVIQP